MSWEWNWDKILSIQSVGEWVLWVLWQHQIWEWVLWNINECIKGPSHWRTSPPPPCIQPSKLPKEPHIHTKHFQIWQTNIAGGSLVKPENCTWSDWIYMSLGYIWLVNFEHNWMFSCNWPFRFCREPQMENMRRNQFSDIETKTSGQIYSKNNWMVFSLVWQDIFQGREKGRFKIKVLGLNILKYPLKKSQLIKQKL